MTVAPAVVPGGVLVRPPCLGALPVYVRPVLELLVGVDEVERRVRRLHAVLDGLLPLAYAVDPGLEGIGIATTAAVNTVCETDRDWLEDNATYQLVIKYPLEIKTVT